MQLNTINKFRPDLSNAHFKGTEESDTELVCAFTAYKEKRPRCCDQRMNLMGQVEQWINDGSYNAKKVWLRVSKSRYRCRACKGTRSQELSIVHKRYATTTRLKNQIAASMKEPRPMKSISKQYKVSPSHVFKILNSLVVVSEPNHPVKGICIDEFKGDANGQKYQLAAYSDRGELLAILPNRKNSTIIKFLKECSVKWSIEFVSMDLYQPFRSAVEQALPKAHIYVDKFHYVRLLEWMIRDFRRRLFNDDPKTYWPLKKFWKVIAKNPEELSSYEQKIISAIKNLHPTVKFIYEFKEKFRMLLKKKDKEIIEINYQHLIKELQVSLIPECYKFANTMVRWKEQIVGSIITGVNNGLVEGNNNRIKVTKRVAYGISKLDNLIKLVFFRNSNYKHVPVWAHQNV